MLASYTAENEIKTKHTQRESKRIAEMRKQNETK